MDGHVWHYITVAVGTCRDYPHDIPNLQSFESQSSTQKNYPKLHTQVSDIPWYPHDIPMALPKNNSISDTEIL